jgi:hypothetical protein
MSSLHNATPCVRVAPSVILLVVTATACATAGATFRSGVGDSYPERPPYRAGTGVPAGAVIARLPIGYQRGATQPASFEPSAAGGTPMAALLAEMNAYADSLGVSALSGGAALGGTPPDVQFGCVPGAAGDCADPAEPGAAVRSSDTEQPRMRLAVGRPSSDWTAATAAALARSGAGHALVLTVEGGQYWVTKRGWANRKSLELGTGYSVQLPWLTSLDAPVNVLQITGALIDRDGKAVRIGAEGLLAKRTGLVMSGVGMQTLVTDTDIEALRTMRRDDLPGRPLVWKAAVKALVDDLVGRA